MDLWYPVMWPIYKRLMTRDGMRTIIAYEKKDPDYFYGFVVADPTDQRVNEKSGSARWYPGLVLFVLVKQNCRREGIARKLFAEAGIDPEQPFLYGCNTLGASRLASKVPNARFHPLAARYPKEKRE
jgi:hypothetical protein